MKRKKAIFLFFSQNSRIIIHVCEPSFSCQPSLEAGDEGLVWKTFQDRLNQYGAMYEDSTVIADATNLQNKYRKMYFDATPGFDKHILVIFDIPFDIARKQNKMRSKERVVPEYAMDKLIAEWEDVSEEVKNLYDEVVYIRNFGTDIVRENLQSQFDEGKIK